MKMFKNIVLSLLILSFTACSGKNSLFSSPDDYTMMVNTLLEKSAKKMLASVGKDEIILVSNFVETSTLKSNTKLSFILSDLLKNRLISKYGYQIREIELSKNFKFGKNGFKVLTRDVNNINNAIFNSDYVVSGRYAITNEQLILFLKVINIRNGHIIASSTLSADISDETLELNKPIKSKQKIEIYQPMVL